MKFKLIVLFWIQVFFCSSIVFGQSTVESESSTINFAAPAPDINDENTCKYGPSERSVGTINTPVNNCDGTFTLSYSESTSDPINIVWFWYRGTTKFGAGSSITVSSSGEYSIKALDKWCLSGAPTFTMDTRYVTVTGGPTISSISNSNSNACSGDVSLTVNYSNFGSSPNIRWYVDGALVSNANNSAQLVIPDDIFLDGGRYSIKCVVTVSDGGVCHGRSETKTMSVNVPVSLNGLRLGGGGIYCSSGRQSGGTIYVSDMGKDFEYYRDYIFTLFRINNDGSITTEVTKKGLDLFPFLDGFGDEDERNDNYFNYEFGVFPDGTYGIYVNKFGCSSDNYDLFGTVTIEREQSEKAFAYGYHMLCEDSETEIVTSHTDTKLYYSRYTADESHLSTVENVNGNLVGIIPKGTYYIGRAAGGLCADRERTKVVVEHHSRSDDGFDLNNNTLCFTGEVELNVSGFDEYRWYRSDDANEEELKQNGQVFSGENLTFDLIEENLGSYYIKGVYGVDGHVTVDYFVPHESLEESDPQVTFRSSQCTTPIHEEHFEVRFFTTEECEDYLNYVETKIYGVNDSDENIVLSASKSYFDLSGQPLQSQDWTYESNDPDSEIRVMVSQPIYDTYNRPAIQTMPAPKVERYFEYDPDFVRTTSGTDEAGRYSSDDFDSEGASAVDASTEGTLGWYYSINNTMEDNVATTAYPFSQTSYYEDGSGETMRSAGPDEAIRMGTGKEITSKMLPIGVMSEELKIYNILRQKLIATDIEDITDVHKQVTVDADGKEVISYQHETGSIASAMVNSNMTAPLDINHEAIMTEDGVRSLQIHIPNAVANTTVTLTNVDNSNFKIYDKLKLANKEDITSNFSIATNMSIVLEPGFYELVGFESLSYKLYYDDYSYNFYDNAGRLRASMTPKGFMKTYGAYQADASNFETYFVTKYDYDFKGNLISMVEPDAGETKYLYKKDGSIRFSENADQRENGYFSYTRYDGSGRPIESGEYTGSTSFSSMNTTTVLEQTGAASEIDKDDKQDWIITYYDLPDTRVKENENDAEGLSGLQANIEAWYDKHYGTGYNHGTEASTINNEAKSMMLAESYEQDFLTGAVSYTESEETTTWYSYDEFGQVTFIVTLYKNMDGGQFFRLDYDYDYYGNVIQVASQKEFLGNSFYHHYEYNKNQQLIEVYTSQTGLEEDQYLHAKYEYYLHGPLKRVEYAEDLQGLDYTYTVQGALKAINNPNTANDPGQDGQAVKDGETKFYHDAFGIQFDYYENDHSSPDYTAAVAASSQNSIYGGNIASVIWGRDGVSAENALNEYVETLILDETLTQSETIIGQESIVLEPGFDSNGFEFSATIDQKKRYVKLEFDAQSYSYEYDYKNQLSEATYAPAISSTVASDVFKVQNLSYDLDGNIQTLQRYGEEGSIQDDFVYDYKDKNNEVKNNQLQSIEGYASYSYNTIGQMTESLSRGDYDDQYYSYDVTGKVTAIYATNTDREAETNPVITYEYDDRGFRILKADENGNETWYIRDASGNIISIYEKEGTEDLTLIEMPIYGSGKIGTSFVNDYRHKYNYELTDHLGNVRAVVSKLKFSEVATMETAVKDHESSIWENVTANRHDDVLYNTTVVEGNESYSARLGGTTDNVGPALSKAVSSGDQITISAAAMYNTSSTDNNGATSIFGLVASAYGVSATGETAAIYEGLDEAFTSASGFIGESPDGVPKAYIQCLVFDADYNDITPDDANQVITSAALGDASDPEILTLDIAVEEDGYVFIYVTNESLDAYVNFDGISVSISGYEITEMTDYYPFGSIANHWEKEEESYRFGYQGQFAEEDEETGFNHFEARDYDAVIGRALTVDPARQFASGYQWVANNPINQIDPTGGDCPKCPGGSEYDAYRNNDSYFGYDASIGAYTDIAPILSTGTSFVPMMNMGPLNTNLTVSFDDAQKIAQEKVQASVELVGALFMSQFAHQESTGDENVKVAGSGSWLKVARAARKLVKSGRAPKSIKRVDIPKLDPNGVPLHGQKPHIHIHDAALNIDGTWKHLPKNEAKVLSNEIKTWLLNNQWTLPK